MACSIMRKNGVPKPEERVYGGDIKIIVVGDKKCGKTRFIEAFAKRKGNTAGSYFQSECARIYPCEYIIQTESMNGIQTESRGVKIFEILGGPDGLLNVLTEGQFDANGIIFMYAIDDRSGFQMMTEKWFNGLKDNKCWKRQPSVLVGNKRDLREDQQVIQRLARDNQAPVTEEEGKTLARTNGIKEFHECFSLDENDNNIHKAFDYIITEGLLDWIRDENQL